ncbi:MAG TPA: hypothetical protein PK716_06765 [Fervidobacterium sp.]|nr:hypothetical protein [Fervidobacterium sp.]HRD20799.1 hypothetical protein [Fervidobacterium sp.]
MSIKKRNMLCLKKKDKLAGDERLLYEPYKNILVKFRELVLKREATDFDPVAKMYHGLFSVPPEIRDYYEALLSITSYYQSSKGGRGRYIEKKLASSCDSCSVSIKLSEIPVWLGNPDIYRKNGISGPETLFEEKKKVLKESPWLWKGEKDEETDIGSMVKSENSIVLMEIKNRVDSGGTAARREIWTSEKFGTILEYLIEDTKIYQKSDGEKHLEFSLAEMLSHFGFNHLEMYIGILFDTKGSLASIEADKCEGFYSSSKTGFNDYFVKKMEKSKKFNIQKIDGEKLYVRAQHSTSRLIIECGALYGDEVTEKLFRRKSSISEIYMLSYDDMWLSQLVSINERTNLSKYGTNYTIILKKIIEEDQLVMKFCNEFLDSEGSEDSLKNLVTYLLKNYADRFLPELLPVSVEKDEYLGDIVQFFAASNKKKSCQE